MDKVNRQKSIRQLKNATKPDEKSWEATSMTCQKSYLQDL